MRWGSLRLLSHRRLHGVCLDIVYLTYDPMTNKLGTVRIEKHF